ncbi:hypothetical protein [Pseudomonas gingeri]
MKDKSTPHQSDSSEKKPRSTPGPVVRIEPGIYKIYTALPSSPPKLFQVSSVEDNEGSQNVHLSRDQDYPESKWKVSNTSEELSYVLLNQGYFRALEAKNGEIFASTIPASSSRPGHLWRFKYAGNEGGIDLFYLENKYTRNLACMQDHSTEDNTNIIECSYSGRMNQKFILVKL